MPTHHLPELRAWLTLLRAPDIGPAMLRQLVLRMGSAGAALDGFERLRVEFAFSAEALSWLRKPQVAIIDADIRWLSEPHHQLVAFDDATFPAQLQEIAAAPAALFVSGDPTLLWQPQVGIVGARSASAAGKAHARTFARALAQAGFAVTSGLADGIDGAAHAGALEVDGKTLAVIGTGPDLVYPKKHRALSAQIEAYGAVISEFPPGTPGRSDHFPRRNRLISGLSLGVVVVEASLQSGSLITARLAADQGREVFAIPGSIQNPLARGCHRLIRDGARLVEDPAEVIAELASLAAAQGARLRARLEHAVPGTGEATAATARPTEGSCRDPDYARLLEALGQDPASIDALAERTGLTIAALSSMLLVLELEGEVNGRGGFYSRGS